MADYKIIGKFHSFRIDPKTQYGIVSQALFKRTELIRGADDKIPQELAFQYITPRGKKLHSLIIDLKEYATRGKEVELFLHEGKDHTLHITNIKELKVQKD